MVWTNRFIVCAVVLFLCLGRGNAQDSGDKFHVRASGSGEASVAPDEVLISATVEVDDKSSRGARERVAQTVKAVTESMSAIGITAPDLVTTRFELHPNMTWDRHGRSSVTGYKCQNQIRIRVDNIEMGGDVLDKLILAGGNDLRVNGFNLNVSNKEEAESEARIKAVRSARKKAHELVTEGGARLGKLVMIEETGNHSGHHDDHLARGMMYDSVAEAGVADTPSQIVMENVKIRVTVHAAFELEH